MEPTLVLSLIVVYNGNLYSLLRSTKYSNFLSLGMLRILGHLINILFSRPFKPYHPTSQAVLFPSRLGSYRPSAWSRPTSLVSPKRTCLVNPSQRALTHPRLVRRLISTKAMGPCRTVVVQPMEKDGVSFYRESWQIGISQVLCVVGKFLLDSRLFGWVITIAWIGMLRVDQFLGYFPGYLILSST